nr:hypothetical protein Iba_chr12bCG0920 [Ipomoea batatas]GME12173.1 hypothetical protein Iba_scaffold13485CG0010 [Ipomoea batatas]
MAEVVQPSTVIFPLKEYAEPRITIFDCVLIGPTPLNRPIYHTPEETCSFVNFKNIVLCIG